RSRSPTLISAYSTRNGFVNPRLGMRRWIGIWPPSNPMKFMLPVRAFWPLPPRPAVLPSPLAWPRPTRFFSFPPPPPGGVPLVRPHLGQLLAAQASGLLGAAELAQPVQGRLHHVVRISRALRFRQDVPDAHGLEHRADAAAGDDPGSFARGLEQHPARSKVAHHLVWDGVARQRDLEQVLLGLLAALADGLRHLVRLA